jgi:hypothetical protein
MNWQDILGQIFGTGPGWLAILVGVLGRELWNYLRATEGRLARGLARREVQLNEPICDDCQTPIRCSLKSGCPKKAKTAEVRRP